MFFYENNLFGGENLYIANYLEDFRFHAHFHRSFELVCVRDGMINIHIDNRLYEARSGDVLVIFPNQIHSFETEGSSGIDLVIFSPEIVGMFASEYGDLVPESNMLNGLSIAKEHVMTKNTYMQKGLLYWVLGTLTEQTEFRKANISGDFKLIHRILSFVESNYTEDCSLKEVARVLKYDYAYLSKQFINTMNMSYTEYLNRFRISKACYFISNESIPIGEVYSKCGFENARSFNRNFKRYTDITPSEFKHRHKSASGKIYDNMI